MITAIINYIKALLGLDKTPSNELQWLEDKVKKSENQLKELESEKTDIDDAIDRLNK